MRAGEKVVRLRLVILIANQKINPHRAIEGAQGIAKRHAACRYSEPAARLWKETAEPVQAQDVLHPSGSSFRAIGQTNLSARQISRLFKETARKPGSPNRSTLPHVEANSFANPSVGARRGIRVNSGPFGHSKTETTTSTRYASVATGKKDRGSGQAP